MQFFLAEILLSTPRGKKKNRLYNEKDPRESG